MSVADTIVGFHVATLIFLLMFAGTLTIVFLVIKGIVGFLRKRIRVKLTNPSQIS